MTPRPYSLWCKDIVVKAVNFLFGIFLIFYGFYLNLKRKEWIWLIADDAWTG